MNNQHRTSTERRQNARTDSFAHCDVHSNYVADTNTWVVSAWRGNEQVGEVGSTQNDWRLSAIIEMVASSAL